MEEENVFEGTIEDQQAAILMRMSELDTTSKEFKELSEILVSLSKVTNDRAKIDNEARAKKREQKLEKMKIKSENKKRKIDRETKEAEFKAQKKTAIITGICSVVVAGIAGFASGYSTKMNRKNLEDTLNFEKTGIVRSAGHKHVSKKG